MAKKGSADTFLFPSKHDFILGSSPMISGRFGLDEPRR